MEHPTPADGHAFVPDPEYPVRCLGCNSLPEFHRWDREPPRNIDGTVNTDRLR